jgi:hypothetical protein
MNRTAEVQTCRLPELGDKVRHLLRELADIGLLCLSFGQRRHSNQSCKELVVPAPRTTPRQALAGLRRPMAFAVGWQTHLEVSG